MDMWENNIGECESHFWGVCSGEETGKACEKPSRYGCAYQAQKHREKLQNEDFLQKLADILNDESFFLCIANPSEEWPNAVKFVNRVEITTASGGDIKGLIIYPY